MLAGAVAGTGTETMHVGAYVVLADGLKSRLFRITGKRSAPHIEELDSATTIDLKRFQAELKKDLAGLGPMGPGDANWACETVRTYLRCDLGV